jgi:hypothetical protein
VLKDNIGDFVIFFPSVQCNRLIVIHALQSVLVSGLKHFATETFHFSSMALIGTNLST